MKLLPKWTSWSLQLHPSSSSIIHFIIPSMVFKIYPLQVSSLLQEAMFVMGIEDRRDKLGDVNRSLGLPLFWLCNIVKNTLKSIFLKFWQIPPVAPWRNHVKLEKQVESSKKIKFLKNMIFVYFFKANFSLKLYMKIY